MLGRSATTFRVTQQWLAQCWDRFGSVQICWIEAINLLVVSNAVGGCWIVLPGEPTFSVFNRALKRIFHSNYTRNAPATTARATHSSIFVESFDHPFPHENNVIPTNVGSVLTHCWVAWWCGRVVKAQCFESCEISLRGFESSRRNYEPQANSQLSCPSFRCR